MATYTIRVSNQSTLDKSYVVTLQPPTVTANGASPEIFTNAWRTFNKVTNGGWDTVVYNETTYAYWAQQPSLSPGVTVDSGGALLMNTATQDTVSFVSGVESGARGFTDLVSPGTAQAGSFEILTTTDFTPASGFAFGLASDNGSGIPSPIATFEAAPNEKYNLTPIVKFYVTDGDFTEGEIMAVTTTSNATAAIDFTGSTFTTATVIQGANGAFSVNYS